jgi:ketosteroid isomerase-like protein
MTQWLFLFLLATAAMGAAAGNPEQEVRAAMEAWRQARIRHDRAALEKLYAPELLYVHSNARRESRAEAIDKIANGTERVEACDFAGMKVQVYGNTAVVWADLTLRTVSGGAPTTLQLGTLHVWVKNPAGWQLVARQAVRLNP